jgi:hypothetical protein
MAIAAFVNAPSADITLAESNDDLIAGTHRLIACVSCP